MLLRRHLRVPKLLVLVLGLIAAMLLAQSPIGEAIAVVPAYLGAFIAGFFFSYGLTTLPALAALAILAGVTDPWGLAFFGALGGVLADFAIFHLFRNDLIPEAQKLSRKLHIHVRKSHVRHFRLLAPVLGGIVLASPLPDEMAMALFGVSHLRTKTWLVGAFVMKFLALLVFAFAVRQ